MPVIGDSRLSLVQFYAAMIAHEPLTIDASVMPRLERAHQAVLAAARAQAPVYGLNTGLGANLGHRIAADDISDFQLQIMAGRAVGCGNPLPAEIGRGVLLYRILSAAQGMSGISPAMFTHLCDMYQAGIAPVIPEFGSIGASDLTQTAYFGLAVVGYERCWLDGELVAADEALARHGLAPPPLQPKEGLALISHSGLSVALGVQALMQARAAINMAKAATVLSIEGFAANRQIFAPDVAGLRPAPGQQQAAAWFRQTLDGAEDAPQRIQDALSFRTIANVMGAAETALQNAVDICENETNGISDTPVVMADGQLVSAANFDQPALALALETLSMAIATVAHSSAERMKRMMDPALSGLPRYLSPHGGRSAGMVPTQKTAAALLAEIRQAAQPVAWSPAVVSEGVEDMASMTPAVAQKLIRQNNPFTLMTGLEALVAVQAIDLRAPASKSAMTEYIHGKIREKIPFLDADRPLGRDIDRTAGILDDACRALM